MNRLLASLLITLIACGNLFPHSHHHGIEPSDHANRPHIHLWGGSHSHADHSHTSHHHGDNLRHSCCDRHKHRTTSHDHSTSHAHSTLHDHSTAGFPVDHDSDAVYLSSAPIFLPSSGNLKLDEDQDCMGFVAVKDDGFAASHAFRNQRIFSVPHRTTLPLFLLHAALRL